MDTSEVILVVSMVFMAYWKNDFLLYLVSGIIIFLFTPNWIDTYPSVTLVMVGFACSLMGQALLLALQAGGPARGWSQFRDAYGRIKSVFS